MEGWIILPFAALIPAWIAYRKGRSFWQWWIYGVLIFIVALPHSIFCSRRQDALDDRAVETGALKKCTSCAELIRAEAQKCRFCGHAFDGRVAVPTTVPAPAPFRLAKEEVAGSMRTRPVVVAIIAVVVIIGVVAFINNRSADQMNASATQVYMPQPKPQITVPASEQLFINIVRNSAEQYNSLTNELAKGGTRPARGKALCASLSGTTATNWAGTIYSLSTNSDGFGVIEIQIAPHLWLKTWNNAISDIGDHTLIQPDSQVFRSAATLTKGQAVYFSGIFSPSPVDCFKETSLGIEGSMSEPEYLFQFTDLRAVL